MGYDPYIATALENRYPDANALHTETWRQVAEVASEGELLALKQDGDFRSAQWESPDSFKSLLVMYRVKAGYIQLLRWLEPYTGLARGGHLISIAASLAIGLLMLWLLASYQSLQAGLIVGPVLLLAGYGPISSAVFPDIAMSALSFAAILPFCVSVTGWVRFYSCFPSQSAQTTSS